MRLRRGFLIVGLLLGFASLTGVLILSREPAHDGKNLGEWLERLNSSDQTDRETARVAIQKIGSKAVPHLLRMLRQKDSAGKIKLHRLLAKQSVIHVRFRWSADQHEKAARGFQALGSAGQDAMLPLIALLNDTNAGAAQATYRHSWHPTAPAAQRALQALGSEAVWAAIPLIKNEKSRRWLYYDLLYKNFTKGTALDDDVLVAGRIFEECEFADIRRDAASAVGAMQRWPELAVPRLTRRLILDRDVSVKAMAAHALGSFGRAASNAVPALLWARSVRGVRETAILALGVIDPDAALEFDTGRRKEPDWPTEYLPLLPPL